MHFSAFHYYCINIYALQEGSKCCLFSPFTSVVLSFKFVGTIMNHVQDSGHNGVRCGNLVKNNGQ